MFHLSDERCRTRSLSHEKGIYLIVVYEVSVGGIVWHVEKDKDINPLSLSCACAFIPRAPEAFSVKWRQN